MILAVLCSDDKDYFSFGTKKPFQRSVLNKAYSNFAKVGGKNGFGVVFTKWNLVKNDNSVSKYWIYDKGWEQKTGKIKPDFFYDKFDLGKKQIALKKKLSRGNKIINSYGMEMFCKDKFEQAKSLSNLTPKTFLIKNNSDLKKNITKIKNGGAILKPRYGLGGQGILILKEGEVVEKIDFEEDFVLQELIDSSCGIPSLKIKGVHDLRCVIVDGKLSYAYVRQPKKGILANIHQGGTAKIVSVPKEILQKLKRIDFYVKKFGERVYTADFIRGSVNGKNKYFLLELNSKPGFDVCCNFGYEKIENKFFAQIFDMLLEGRL